MDAKSVVSLRFIAPMPLSLEVLKDLKRAIAVYLMVNIVALPIFILYLLPVYPNTFLGWLTVLLVGAPLLLLGELLGAALFNDSYKNKFTAKFGESVTSIIRFLHLLVVVAFFIVLTFFINWLVSDFISKHFGTIGG